jgi:hypothetical protein
MEKEVEVRVMLGMVVQCRFERHPHERTWLINRDNPSALAKRFAISTDSEWVVGAAASAARAFHS